MRFVEDALSLGGTVSKEERRKRGLFFYISVAKFVASVVGSLISADSSLLLVRVMILNSLLVATFGVVTILCKRKLTPAVVLATAFGYAVTCFVGDLSARTLNRTLWGNLVLVVDFMLVMQVEERYCVGIVVFTVVWLVVMWTEERWRWGALDAPGLPEQGYRQERMFEMVECASLPCPSPSTESLVIAGQVFVIDFIATRAFARDLLKEQTSMQRTIATVQDIASLLAGYDVEKVSELLEEHGGELPEGMTAALRKLEQNLRLYKAYLPKTCLPFEDEKDQCVEPGGSELDGTDSDYQSTVSAATSSTSAAVRRTSFCAPPLLLSSTKATLLTLNIKDTLHRLEEDSAQFSDLFTTVLLKTLQATDSRRGMVDVFVGDRIHCSFNASKQCASHATSALHAASMLMRAGLAASVNVGVAMGTVLRGDMGCDVMRRFSMVGTLVRDVHGMERAGRMLGCDVLCNRLCFSDAECEHDLRLLPCKVEVARDCEAQVVAELVSKEEDAVDVADEWMYQIGGKKHWEDYNQAVRKYLKGEVSAAVVNSAACTEPLAATPVRVAASPSRTVLRLPIHQPQGTPVGESSRCSVKDFGM